MLWLAHKGVHGQVGIDRVIAMSSMLDLGLTRCVGSNPTLAAVSDDW